MCSCKVFGASVAEQVIHGIAVFTGGLYSLNIPCVYEGMEVWEADLEEFLSVILQPDMFFPGIYDGVWLAVPRDTCARFQNDLPPLPIRLSMSREGGNVRLCLNPVREDRVRCGSARTWAWIST